MKMYNPKITRHAPVRHDDRSLLAQAHRLVLDGSGRRVAKRGLARRSGVDHATVYRLARMKSIRFLPMQRIMAALSARIILRDAVGQNGLAQWSVQDESSNEPLAHLRQLVEARWRDRPRIELCRKSGVSHPVLYRLLRGEPIRVVYAERIAAALGAEFAIEVPDA